MTEYREIEKTGRRRYRRGFFGGLILQIEVRAYYIDYSSAYDSPKFLVWRDAKITDLTNEQVA